MSDLIERQAAIDATAYSNISVTISGKRGFQNYKEEFEKACVAIRDKYIEALKNLPSAQPETQWIPCSERMPEIDETVLITIKEKYDGDKEYHYHTDVADHLINDGWLTFNDWDEGQEIHIIAWMPLPEPWKGEEK